MSTLSKKSVRNGNLTLFISLVMVLALTGCSNTEDESPELDETTDASLSEPTEYIPASEDGPAQNVPEPQLPAGVAENSEGGAQAALDYFWSAIDYARLTGDTTPLASVSHPECKFCTDHIEGWESRYADGDWAILHGDISIEVQVIETHVDEFLGDEWLEVSFQLVEPAAELFVDGIRDEEESLNEPSEAEWLADMSFDASAQRWNIEWMGLQEDLEIDQ